MCRNANAQIMQRGVGTPHSCSFFLKHACMGLSVLYSVAIASGGLHVLYIVDHDGRWVIPLFRSQGQREGIDIGRIWSCAWKYSKGNVCPCSLFSVSLGLLGLSTLTRRGTIAAPLVVYSGCGYLRLCTCVHQPLVILGCMTTG